MARVTKKTYSYINLGLFTVVLTIFGILFFVLPRQRDSEFEKRALCPQPKFSWDSLFYGRYIDSLDHYVADNFPFRDRFVSVSFNLAEKRGIRSEEVGFYKTVSVDGQVPTDVDTTMKMVSNVDSASTDLPPLDTAGAGPGELAMNGGLLIYNGKAMEVFGGTTAMAKSYASAVNKYQEALAGKGVTIYDVVVPSSIEFNASGDYAKMSRSEKTNIDLIYSNLSPGIRAVDAYSLLAAHRNEYTYFGTDHHWTGLGAYYAYVAFCNSAGLTPVQLSAMTHKTKKNYLGSLYYLTRDSRLKEKPDSVEYWMVPGNHKTYRWGTSLTKPVAGSLYAEMASGGNSYGVFLGGDNPLMRIDTDVKNGRKVLVVKNSYGNPFSTYLVANFEQVFVVDYRYFNGSLLDLISDNKITDLVFINGVFSANTPWHIKMMAKVMHGTGVKPKPQPRDSSPADKAVNAHADSLKRKGA